MKLLFRITLAKLGKNAKTSAFQAAAVLVSMFLVSFFLCLVASLRAFIAANPTFGLEAVDGESLLTVASIREFFGDILSGTVKIAGAIAVLSAASLFIFTRMRAERSRQFFATLTSIGATGSQKRAISLMEAALLYGPPVVLGSALGFLPSHAFATRIARIFVSGYSPKGLSLLTPLLLASLGVGAVLLLACFTVTSRGGSVIESVKAYNKREAGQRHSYRQSYTFRHMPIEQRIAKKGVAYYKSAYRRIAFMLCACATYPLLAVLFFLLVSGTSVSDYTPGYGIDVASLAMIFAEGIARVGLLAFLLLFTFGVISAVYVIKVHGRIRRETMQVYKSVGMTERGIRRVLHYEYGTCVLHAFLGLVFLLVLLVVFIHEI